MHRSCAHVRKDTAENECKCVCRISEGKSTLLIFERHAEYVKNQEKEDMLYEQISIKEYMDPFNPDKNNNNKPKK